MSVSRRSLTTKLIEVAEAAAISTENGIATWSETDKPDAFLYTGPHSSLLIEKGRWGGLALTLMDAQGRTVGSIGNSPDMPRSVEVPGSATVNPEQFMTQSHITSALDRLYTVVMESQSEADEVIENTLRDLGL